MTAAESLAARFYSDASPALSPARPKGPEASEAASQAFSSFLDVLQQGERTAEQGLAGRADAQSVVTALAASEVAVQTAVTMRDKVVEAYQEILRMPV